MGKVSKAAQFAVAPILKPSLDVAKDVVIDPVMDAVTPDMPQTPEPPPPPEAEDVEVKKDVDKERRRVLARRGFRSTILAGDQQNTSVQRKTLLGQ